MFLVSKVKSALSTVDSTPPDAKGEQHTLDETVCYMFTLYQHLCSAKVESKGVGVGKDPAKARIFDSLTSKKSKTVTTSGEHPARLFATKKKKASMQLLTKTIESCKASCGIDKLQVR